MSGHPTDISSEFPLTDLSHNNFQAFLHLYDNEMLEDEEEFSWEEEKDELDDEYDRIQSASQERMKSLDDNITETEQLLKKQAEEMDLAKELVRATSFPNSPNFPNFVHFREIDSS